MGGINRRVGIERGFVKTVTTNRKTEPKINAFDILGQSISNGFGKQQCNGRNYDKTKA